MDFGRAIAILKNGGKVYRQGWNGKDMWLALQVQAAHSKMTLPYYLHGHRGWETCAMVGKPD